MIVQSAVTLNVSAISELRIRLTQALDRLVLATTAYYTYLLYPRAILTVLENT